MVRESAAATVPRVKILQLDVYIADGAYNTGGTPSTTIGSATSYHKVESSQTTTTDSNGNTVYIISQKILPTQMADEIVFTIPLSNGNTYTYTTSVKDYAADVMSSLSTNEQAALTAMLDYGSATQELAAEQEESTIASSALANDGTYQTFTSDELTALNNYAKTTSSYTSWSGAVLSSMNMNFNYNFNFGMSYDKSLSDGYTISATLGGTSHDAIQPTDTEEDYSNSIIIEDLTAFDLLKDLAVTLQDTSSNTYVTTVSPMYYVRLMVTSEDSTSAQIKVGQMLYKYVTAVSAL